LYATKFQDKAKMKMNGDALKQKRMDLVLAFLLEDYRWVMGTRWWLRYFV